MSQDRTHTRAELRARAQVLADDENGQIATDAQYNEWLDESFGFVWDLLITSGVYPQIDTHDITIASTGSGTYGLSQVDRGIEALATDHYAVIHVYEKRGDDDLRMLHRLNPHDYHRAVRGNGNSRYWMPYGDMVAANKIIRLFPKPSVGEIYQVLYVPTPYLLSSDSTDVPSMSAWVDRFLVIDVAMKARLKEESGIRDLQSERNAILEQIQTSKTLRSLEALPRESSPDGDDDVLNDPASWSTW